MYSMAKVGVFFSCLILCQWCFAGSFGEIAENLKMPVLQVINLVRAVIFLAGGGLVVGSIFKYLEHRRNPVEVRLSIPIVMLITGAALIVLGLVPVSDLI